VRRVAIGDPQAPLATFFAVLDRHALRGADGRLRSDVMLISMGDHFDWGKPNEAARAADDGLRLLEWLASHDDEQVVLIAGNHDLGRVGELSAFDDESFARARAEATVVYRDGKTDREGERAFLERWPALPTAELAARDFSSYRASQRDLVTELLRSGRFRLAWAPDDERLFLHAGITAPQLRAAGIDPTSGAKAIAAALDRALKEAVAAWPGPPALLDIPNIHRPGDAAYGEGDGVLYHRAARDVKPRRYDPRELPLGLLQAIGHVRDKKSRELLGGEWTDGLAAEDGPLRHLVTNGNDVHYQRGLPDRVNPNLATMIFLDSGMNHTPPDCYDVLEV
jgi:hypothetical protein